MNTVTSEEIKRIILEDGDAQEAYAEAQYRRRIATRLVVAMNRKGVSYRRLAESMNTGKSQVQRLLGKQRGGSLTLLTLVKAARALGLRVEEMLEPDDSTLPGEFAGVLVRLDHKEWEEEPTFNSSFCPSDYRLRGQIFGGEGNGIEVATA